MENRSPPQGDDAPPEIPGYRLLHLISRGGMGAVYLAEQEMLRRQIALKVTLPFLGDIDPGFPDRFAREAKATANLDHPNIVRVHDAGQASGRSYLAMEYIGDGTLKELLAEREDGLAHRWICGVVAGICEGLHAAHTAGYIHRDIKPDNVLMRSGEIPIVTDFGIAKAVDANPKLTQTVGTMGSPYYMSPEQLRGEQVDHRSDLYGVGVMLFEMLERRTPFEGETAFAVYYQHLTEAPPALSPQNEAFSDIVHALLAKQADQRQSTARLVTEQLRGLATRAGDGMGLPFSGTRPALQRTDAGRAEAAARSAALPTGQAAEGVPETAPTRIAPVSSDPPDKPVVEMEPPEQAATTFKPVATAAKGRVSKGASVDQDGPTLNDEDRKVSEAAAPLEPDLPAAAETSFMPLPPTPGERVEAKKTPPSEDPKSGLEKEREQPPVAQTSFMPLSPAAPQSDQTTDDSDQPDLTNEAVEPVLQEPSDLDPSSAPNKRPAVDELPAAAATSFMPLPPSKSAREPAGLESPITGNDKAETAEDVEERAPEPAAETSFMPLALSGSAPDPGTTAANQSDQDQPPPPDAEPDAPAETSFMPLAQSTPPAPSTPDVKDPPVANEPTPSRQETQDRENAPLATAVMPQPDASSPVRRPVPDQGTAPNAPPKPPPAATAVMSAPDIGRSDAAPATHKSEPETDAEDHGWIDRVPKKRSKGKWIALLLLAVVAGAWGVMFLRDNPFASAENGDASANVGGLYVTTTPPGAQIYISNRYYGTTPMLIEDLNLGLVPVRLKADGFESFNGVATVEAGRNNELEAVLVPLP